MVLAGGPDRERAVSLMSGAEVACALERAGHEVTTCDTGPDDLSALERFETWGGDVVFPVLHGRWGEGGALQRVLDERGLAYVGCRAASASLCMDKAATKRTLAVAGLPTPEWELLDAEASPSLDPPLVIKPNDDGSSIDLRICHSRDEVDRARRELASRNATLLYERCVKGRELTVGVIERPSGFESGDTPLDGDADASASGSLLALPPIQIVPATAFYDYEAKYVRNDTRYLFEIEAADGVLPRVRELAAAAHRATHCRHLSRVDFMLDDQDRPWVLEINTLPGFTAHSLLPMAAARVGLAMPALVDHLARLAHAEASRSVESVREPARR